MAKKENTQDMSESTNETKRVSRRKTAAINTAPKELLFSQKNYTIIGAGLAVVIVGFLLMMGGGMEDATEWDSSSIYSFRRITLAPFTVLLGFAIIIFSIFKSSK